MDGTTRNKWIKQIIAYEGISVKTEMDFPHYQITLIIILEIMVVERDI